MTVRWAGTKRFEARTTKASTRVGPICRRCGRWPEQVWRPSIHPHDAHRQRVGMQPLFGGTIHLCPDCLGRLSEVLRLRGSGRYPGQSAARWCAVLAHYGLTGAGTASDDPFDLDRTLAMDFEASTLPEHGGTYPIEVGLAPVRRPGERIAWLIRPTEAWRVRGTWNPQSEAVHGIALERLMDEGLEVEAVVSRLDEVLDGKVVVSDNAAAEAVWLGLLYDAIGREPVTRVVGAPALMQALACDARALVNEVKAEAHRRVPREHRAGEDAHRLAETIRILAGDIDG